MLLLPEGVTFGHSVTSRATGPLSTGARIAPSAPSQGATDLPKRSQEPGVGRIGVALIFHCLSISSRLPQLLNVPNGKVSGG